MILDKHLSYNNKVIISLISIGFWIYFRTFDCYSMIPRHSLFAVIFVMTWAYLFLYDPLFCPIGLAILILYKEINDKNNIKKLNLFLISHKII